jgi:hypothetical protein
VKAGDLVQITARGNEFFLILERNMEPWDAERFDDSSKFADWKLLNIETGKICYTRGRFMEVVSESR